MMLDMSFCFPRPSPLFEKKKTGLLQLLSSHFLMITISFGYPAHLSLSFWTFWLWLFLMLVAVNYMSDCAILYFCFGTFHFCNVSYLFHWMAMVMVPSVKYSVLSHNWLFQASSVPHAHIVSHKFIYPWNCILQHLIPGIFLWYNWDHFDMSFDFGDEVAHLCYSYFVPSTMMVIRSLLHYFSRLPGFPIFGKYCYSQSCGKSQTFLWVSVSICGCLLYSSMITFIIAK